MIIPKQVNTINDLKKFSKIEAKKTGKKLSEVQNNAAIKLGFNSWAHIQAKMGDIPLPSVQGKVTFSHIPSISIFPEQATTEDTICITVDELMSKLIFSIQNEKIMISEIEKKYISIRNLIILNIENLEGKKHTKIKLKDFILKRKHTLLVSTLSRSELLKKDEYYNFLLS